MRNTIFAAFLTSLATILPNTVYAQDADDDALGDILNDDSTATAAEERTAVEQGRTDEIIGAEKSDIKTPTDGRSRIIKTLQKKNFLKIGRSEIAPHIGYVTNDPFINRYLAGASYTYHLTEIFAVEVIGSYSPDFGDADWKPITAQLVNENKVSPDISKLTYYGNLNFQFSPIYGKIAIGDRTIMNFDVFGAFGTGIAHTLDDAEAMQAEAGEDFDFFATQSQHHATTNFGGGMRFIFSKNLALRIEGRSMQYIETIASTTLEMKQNFLLLASASIFLPGMD
jgi:outer membrane beta-barrel protein